MSSSNLNNPKLQNLTSKISIINYRNCKFQGQLQEKSYLPNTISGMVLDQNYLLALGRWKNGVLQGPVFIIYPDCSIFYGHIKNKKANGFCCKMLFQKQIIYFWGDQNKQSEFIYEQYKSNCLNLCEYVRQSQKSKKIQIKHSISFKDEQQKWSAIQNYLKQKIIKQIRTYKLFIKQYFLTLIQPQKLKIKITQTKDIFQFGYNNSSIGCKIWDTIQSSNGYNIICLGFYDQKTEMMEIYKKYHHNAKRVQQYLDGQIFQYKINNQRSIQCGKELVKYYKSSTNFVNHFINLGYLYQIHNLLSLFSSTIRQKNTKYFAKQLQIGWNNKQEQLQTKKSNLIDYKKVQQQYQRLTKSKYNHKRSRQQYLQLSRRASGIQIQNQKNKQKISYNQEYSNNSLHKKSTNFSPQQKRSPSRKNRNFNYLQQENNLKIQKRTKYYQQNSNQKQNIIKRSPKKFDYLADKISNNKQQNILNKEYSRKNTRHQNESINTMIKNYQNIRQIQKSISRKKLNNISSNVSIDSFVPSRAQSPLNSQLKNKNPWR